MTEKQKEYFKDSQIRDSRGEMIPCYHYTTHEFDAFDKNSIGKTSGDSGYFGQGFYFTARPEFNSCCFADKEHGEKLIKLECYLNVRNPFYMERIGKPGFSADNPYLYDAESFLEYLKNNADPKSFDGDGGNIVVTEEDFVAYLKAEHEYDGEYSELIEKYEAGEIDFYDEVDGVSLDELQHTAEREGEIITPNNLTFFNLHRGLLAGYSEQITDYAKINGCDGIISDGLPEELTRPTEIVVFEPEQIKSINNFFPTKSVNFLDNEEDYRKECAANCKQELENSGWRPSEKVWHPTQKYEKENDIMH